MSLEQNPHARFSQSSRADQLKSLTRDAVADVEFENKWQKLTHSFQRWETSPTARLTSTLNVRLEFLRQVCAVFPEAKLNKNPWILELVLADSGAKNVGDRLPWKRPSGVTETVKVVKREISDAFGIVYTLESERGSRFTHEFFD